MKPVEQGLIRLSVMADCMVEELGPSEAPPTFLISIVFGRVIVSDRSVVREIQLVNFGNGDGARLIELKRG